MSRISSPDKEEIMVTFHRGNVCMPHLEIMHDAQAAVQSEIRNPSEFIHVLYLYRSSTSFPESLLQNLSELHWLNFLPWSAKRQVATGKTRDIISFAHLSSQNLEVEPWKKRKKKKRISLFLTNFSAPRKHRSSKPFEDCHPPDPNKRNYVVRVLGLMQPISSQPVYKPPSCMGEGSCAVGTSYPSHCRCPPTAIGINLMEWPVSSQLPQHKYLAWIPYTDISLAILRFCVIYTWRFDDYYPTVEMAFASKSFCAFFCHYTSEISLRIPSHLPGRVNGIGSRIDPLYSSLYKTTRWITVQLYRWKIQMYSNLLSMYIHIKGLSTWRCRSPVIGIFDSLGIATTKK